MSENSGKKSPSAYLAALSFHNRESNRIEPADIIMMADHDQDKLMRNLAFSLTMFAEDAGGQAIPALKAWSTSAEPFSGEKWTLIKEQEKALHDAGLNISVPMPLTEMPVTGSSPIHAFQVGLAAAVTAQGDATLIPAALTDSSDGATAMSLAATAARAEWGKQDITSSITHFTMHANARKETINQVNDELNMGLVGMARSAGPSPSASI